MLSHDEKLQSEQNEGFSDKLHAPSSKAKKVGSFMQRFFARNGNSIDMQNMLQGPENFLAEPQITDPEQLKAKQEEDKKSQEQQSLAKAASSLKGSMSPLIQGFHMPYTAGFGAPGPSIADRFAYSTGNSTVQGMGEGGTIKDAVDVNLNEGQ